MKTNTNSKANEMNTTIITSRTDLHTYLADTRSDLTALGSEYVEAVLDQIAHSDHPAWGDDWTAWLDAELDALVKATVEGIDALKPSAREAGVAWAEREAEALVDSAPSGEWIPDVLDARPLLPHGLDEETEEAWLVTCVGAANRRWDELCGVTGEEKRSYKIVTLAEHDGTPINLFSELLNRESPYAALSNGKVCDLDGEVLMRSGYDWEETEPDAETAKAIREFWDD